MPDEKETLIPNTESVGLHQASGEEKDGTVAVPAKTDHNIDDLLFGVNNKQAAFLKSIVDNHSIKSVLDLVIRNSDTAVLFSSLTENDASPEQDTSKTDELNFKSSRAGVLPVVTHGDIRDLSGINKERFNLIACLRNSLPRLVNETDIWGTLAQLYLRLEPAGILLIQIFNYECLVKEKSSTLSGLNEYYSDLGVKVCFDCEQGKSEAKLIYSLTDYGGSRNKAKKYIIPVRPVFQKELNIWLAELGYEKIKSYSCYNGGFALVEPWEIITIAYRPGSEGHH